MIMSLLVQLIEISKTEFKINVTTKIEEQISALIDGKLKPLELYALTKFVCLCENNQRLKKQISEANLADKFSFKLDMSEKVKSNFVL